MKRVIETGMILMAFILLFAGRAAAQGAPISGQVLSVEGKPDVGLTVTIKNDTGRSFTLKTDKSGNFTQIAVPEGVYTVTLSGGDLPQPFTTQFQQDSSGKPWDINLKEIAAAASASNKGANDAAAAAFSNMKSHFQTGTTAMNDADALKKQLATASADQKADINSKLSADYQTALTEYTAAEQAVGPKDAVNHALIWANIGRADDGIGKYDDAVAAYQKAIDLKPNADYYSDMSTALVNSGTAQRDPAVLQQKVTDASTACGNAVTAASAAPASGGPVPAGVAPAGGAATGPIVASRCYKNMGIVLSNKGDLKQAIDPLKKATDANPKDAQGWFLLASAYVGSVDSKTVGDKEIFTFDPATGDALQKCVDADPSGQLGAQCKDMQASVTQMGGGVSTTIGTPPPAKKKK